VKNAEYVFSQVQPWEKGGASYTNNDNAEMIEHEVALHHLAIEMKRVFDDTLSERHVNGVPGTFGQERREATRDSG